MSEIAKKKRISIREDIFTTPLDLLDKARLQGSRCRNCGEVAFGVAYSCQNCANQDMEVIPLSPEGILWTYTVIRNQPPGDYKGPNPFVPFGEGLVEMPEGIRIKTPLGGRPEQLKIGTRMKLIIYKLYDDVNGNEVIAFRFDPE